MRLSITRQVFSQRRNWFISLISLAIAGLLVACAGSAVRNPVPGTLSNQAIVVGMNDVRFWGDQTPPNLNAIIKEKFAQMRASRPQLLKAGRKAQIRFLTISGGGSDGAFSAGLLVGWSASGTRPEFEIVTGVSTGALAAPFAFLGSEYDSQLREIFTHYNLKSIAALKISQMRRGRPELFRGKRPRLDYLAISGGIHRVPLQFLQYRKD